MVAPQWGQFQKPNETAQEDDLQQEYSQEIPGQIQDQQTSEGEKPQWGNFLSPTTYQGQPDNKEQESIFDYLVRNTITNASRLGEQVAGRFGNLEKFGKDLLVNLPQTGGLIGWGISQLVGPEKWESMVRGPIKDQTLLPTSEQFKQGSQALTKGYTKPKTKGEERLQGFTEDVGAIFAGGRGVPAVPLRNPMAQRAINTLVIPAVANGTKAIVEDAGFGEDKANMAKMAIWLPLSLAANVNAPAFASQLMNRGRQGLPNTLQANIPRFTTALDTIEHSPLLLSSDPRTALARQVLNGVRTDIANGQTNAQSLLTMYDAVNAAKRNRGMFEMGARDQAFARRSINAVRDVIRDEIMNVGQNHPQALQDWQNGVQAWATIHQSNAISNWVESIAKGPYAKMIGGPAAALFGMGTLGTAKSLPGFISGGAAAAIPASYKTGQALYRMWNDENLRDYYWRAISAAQQQNAPAFINNYNKLNQKLKESSIKGAASPKKKKS